MRRVLCLVCLASATAVAEPASTGPATGSTVTSPPHHPPMSWRQDLYYPDGLRHHFELGFTIEGEGAAARDSMSQAPSALVLARGTFRWIGKHNYYNASPVLGFDVAGGWASPSEPAYAVHVKAGIRAHMWLFDGRPHYVGFLVGAGRDAIGDSVPAAWTVPLDAFYQVHVAETKIVGVRSGPHLSLDRALGWSTSLELKLLGNRESASAFWPRDIALALEANYIAGVLFTGVSVGVSSRPHPNYWERW
jgi:hypothetical protein